MQFCAEFEDSNMNFIFYQPIGRLLDAIDAFCKNSRFQLEIHFLPSTWKTIGCDWRSYQKTL